MNLLFRNLLSSIDDLAKAKGLKDYRVAFKRNARGEMVIALIVADEKLSAEKLETARERSHDFPR